MKFTSLNIKIGGAAGEGIKSVGLTLSKCFTRSGYYTFDYSEYPSLIRGGHNTYQSHISLSPIFSQKKNIDILIALNQETINLHQEELIPQTVIIYDPAKIKLDLQKLTGHYLGIDLNKLAIASGGTSLMANIVALGAVMYLTGLEVQVLKDLIKEIFSKKGDKIILPNQKAAQSGFDYAVQYASKLQKPLVKAVDKKPKYLVSGNEAIALGAISAGMQFFSAYPMTPATGILHYLAGNAKKYNLVVKHADDEISAANMIVGASFSGVRSMTATSGGGFCLMVEALGMAGIMELPAVFVNGMRSGPSTGMPTWHDQGDLLFAIHASHGEFPKMVLTPGDIKESFDYTRLAFYYAEKYQLPVIILTDKYLAESTQAIEDINPQYQNNKLRQLPFPGQKGRQYLANSYEHDDQGFATEEISVRNRQVANRLKKFDTLKLEISKLPLPVYGDRKSQIGLISWGSCKGPILEGMKLLGKPVAFLNLPLIWPFPVKQVENFIKNKKILVNIECNATGQLGQLLRQTMQIKPDKNLLKFDGRPFYPEEIAKYLKHVIPGLTRNP